MYEVAVSTLFVRHSQYDDFVLTGLSDARFFRSGADHHGQGRLPGGLFQRRGAGFCAVDVVVAERD